jgi:hypothetical protein
MEFVKPVNAKSMNSYSQLKNIEPKLVDCFFAFSKSQYNEGIIKHNLQDKKIFRADGGLFGTQEGIAKLFADYEEISKKITENCQPQDVYDNEFDNHECSYVGDDEEAIKIVVSYFGDEKAKEVKRRFAVTKIENLKFD